MTTDSTERSLRTQKMHLGGTFRCLFASLSLAGTLGGCAIGPELERAVTAPNNDRLEITWLHAYRKSNGLLVAGKVRRLGLGMRPVQGHLHVVAHFTDGSPPIMADGHWGTFSNRTNNLVSFSIFVRTPRPDRVREVVVEYRPEQDDVLRVNEGAVRI